MVLNFTPHDWVEIGGSWIAVWWLSRFAFTFILALFGGSPNDAEITVTHNIALNASVEKVETDE